MTIFKTLLQLPLLLPNMLSDVAAEQNLEKCYELQTDFQVEVIVQTPMHLLALNILI